MKGVYLKHSKILIELNVIVQEQELKQQHNIDLSEEDIDEIIENLLDGEETIK